MEVNNISNVEQKNNTTIKSSKTTSTNKSDFSSYLGESKSLDSIFDEAAEKYNVPVNLLKAVGKAESNFNEKAVSSCGAQGIMQLMPATAASLGVSDSFDAEDNIMGGAKYLSSLLKKYDGNTKLTLAAYNAGSGNVAKYGGIPPFKETQNYVVKVMNYMNQDIDTKTTSNTGQSTTTNETSNNYITPTRTNYEVPTTFSKLPSTILKEASDTSSLTGSLDDIFSYDDYLYFLNKLVSSNNDNDEEDNAFYASKQINYNVPVMNILNI